MAEYIEREELAKKLRAEADKCKIGEGDTMAGLYLANCILDELPTAPTADVVPAGEMEMLRAEIERLKAENKRLHEENFWLTGLGGKQ